MKSGEKFLSDSFRRKKLVMRKTAKAIVSTCVGIFSVKRKLRPDLLLEINRP